jgi:hypothetical protein
MASTAEDTSSYQSRHSLTQLQQLGDVQCIDNEPIQIEQNAQKVKDESESYLTLNT